jgi:hypothetical protein
VSVAAAYASTSTPDPGSPLWWLVTLEQRLLRRQADMLMFDRYYRGEHPLPFLTRAHDAKMRDEFRRLLEESRSNFMRLVVDATEERLGVEGFRLSGERDPVSDEKSWEIWQANDMDSQVQTAFLESLIKGVSYLSVWKDDDSDKYADIYVEDPLQTIVGYEAGSNYRRRACALRIWLDDLTGMRRANVYLPNGIYKYEAPAEFPQNLTPSIEQQILIPWVEREDDFVRNPLGIVPIIPLRNRPRLLVEGESELADVYRVQNQINAFIFLLAIAGYFGAHRQRWATGMTLMEKDGKPVEPFNVAIDRLWQNENPDAKFGDFAETNLSGYIESIEQKVLHIAVTTRTPRHYLIQQGQSPSGDAIQSAESGLVKKVERKQRTFSDGLEEAIRLARMFQGETDFPVDSEIVWDDPQSHTPGTITDAVVKQWASRMIPHATALERLGYTQTQIRRILQTLKDNPEEFAPEAVLQSAELSAQKRDITSTVPSGA